MVRRFLPTAFIAALLFLPVIPHAEGTDEYTIGRLMAQLPQGKRRILENALKQAGDKNSVLHNEKNEVELELEQLLAAPDFNTGSYLDKSAKLGTLRAKMHANLDDAIAMVATQFTQGERGILIKMRKLWRLHGYHQEWSCDDEEDNHQPGAE